MTAPTRLTAPRKVRPTYAGVTATLALIVALGGTGYAAGLGRGSVDTRELARGAVTTGKIKGQAVTSGKVRNGTLRGKDFRRGVLPASRAFHVAVPRLFNYGPTLPAPRNDFPTFGGEGVEVIGLTLPAGDYIVTMTVAANNLSTGSAELACDLVGGVQPNRSETTLAPGTQGAVAATTAARLRTPGRVVVKCYRFGGSDMRTRSTSLTATQVSTLVTP